MKRLIARANPPVVRNAGAAPPFQRGQAKRRLESTGDSSMGYASKKTWKQGGVGKSGTLDKSEIPRKSERLDMSARLYESEKIDTSERVYKSERGYGSEPLDESEKEDKSEKNDNLQRVDESKSSGDYPPLKKGGRWDLLFAGHSFAKPCTTHVQTICRS